MILSHSLCFNRTLLTWSPRFYVRNDVVPPLMTYDHPLGPAPVGQDHTIGPHRNQSNRGHTSNMTGSSFAQQLYASAMKTPISSAPLEQTSTANVHHPGSGCGSWGSHDTELPTDRNQRSSSITLDCVAPPPTVTSSQNAYPPHPKPYLATSANPADYSNPDEQSSVLSHLGSGSSSWGSHDVESCSDHNQHSNWIKLDSVSPPPTVTSSQKAYPPQLLTYLATSANPANYSNPNEQSSVLSRGSNIPPPGVPCRTRSNSNEQSSVLFHASNIPPPGAPHHTRSNSNEQSSVLSHVSHIPQSRVPHRTRSNSNEQSLVLSHASNIPPPGVPHRTRSNSNEQSLVLSRGSNIPPPGVPPSNPNQQSLVLSCASNIPQPRVPHRTWFNHDEQLLVPSHASNIPQPRVSHHTPSYQPTRVSSASVTIRQHLLTFSARGPPVMSHPQAASTIHSTSGWSAPSFTPSDMPLYSRMETSSIGSLPASYTVSQNMNQSLLTTSSSPTTLSFTPTQYLMSSTSLQPPTPLYDPSNGQYCDLVDLSGKGNSLYFNPSNQGNIRGFDLTSLYNQSNPYDQYQQQTQQQLQVQQQDSGPNYTDITHQAFNKMHQPQQQQDSSSSAVFGVIRQQQTRYQAGGSAGRGQAPQNPQEKSTPKAQYNLQQLVYSGYQAPNHTYPSGIPQTTSQGPVHQPGQTYQHLQAYQLGQTAQPGQTYQHQAYQHSQIAQPSQAPQPGQTYHSSQTYQPTQPQQLNINPTQVKQYAKGALIAGKLMARLNGLNLWHILTSFWDTPGLLYVTLDTITYRLCVNSFFCIQYVICYTANSASVRDTVKYLLCPIFPYFPYMLKNQNSLLLLYLEMVLTNYLPFLHI